MAGLDPAGPFPAYLDGEPVGYIQYYHAAEVNDDWRPDVPGPGVLGIDQFLADGDRLDPHTDNLRAIRYYAKVGFREAARITTPERPAVMMVLRRPQG